MIRIKRYFFQAILGLLVLGGASLWKMQLAFGAHSLLFTASNIFGPLLGVVFGPWAVLAILLVKRCIAWNFFGSPLLNVFSTYIPTLCAAWYWNVPSKVIRLFLPLICMVAFILHPIGFQASVYSLYWLIPVIIYFVQPRTVFLHALASTFIQHAVGSVIWLYVMPSTSMFWYSLLPVVFVERLLFASGMVVVMHLIQACRAFVIPRFSSLQESSFFFG